MCLKIFVSSVNRSDSLSVITFSKSFMNMMIWTKGTDSTDKKSEKQIIYGKKLRSIT